MVFWKGHNSGLKRKVEHVTKYCYMATRSSTFKVIRGITYLNDGLNLLFT